MSLNPGKSGFVSKLQKPSKLRPATAIPYKRKLPNQENNEGPAPKLYKPRPIKPVAERVQSKPLAVNNYQNKTTQASSKAHSKPAVKSWEPRHVVELRKASANTSAKLQSLTEQFEKDKQNWELTEIGYNEKYADLEKRLAEIMKEKELLEKELVAKKDQIVSLTESLQNSNSTINRLDMQLNNSKSIIKQQEGVLEDNRIQINYFKKEIAEQKVQLEESRIKLIEEEVVRKKLHNTIQELKGNIRVYGRVRPLLGEELVGKENVFPSHISFPDPNNKIIEIDKLPTQGNNEGASRRLTMARHEFQFDKVFSPSASQEVVFEEISQLVQSALDGYNVCIFAYGQTGSGKTYTMEGVGVGTHKGVIQRSVQQVFESVNTLANKSWQYQVEVSFLEIYNETIRDLLNGTDNVAKESDSGKHEIRLVGPNTNEVYVTDLTTHVVTCEEEVQELIRKAAQARSVAETRCNERSSRSHSIFRMKLTGTNTNTSETCSGLLNLVDLAGSERLKESGSQGQRLKETQNINKSLANLSNVIMALANKDAHVPYRNSKLTHLLQNCLGGNAKVLMFVNVSPKEECLQETLNSLRFATKVNQCNIGVAQKKFK